jgi:hypothetical protein
MRAFNSLWASGSPGGSGMAPGEDHAEGEEEGRALSLSLSEVKQAAGPEIVASSMRKIRDMDANIAYFLSEVGPDSFKIMNHITSSLVPILSVSYH